MQNPEGSEDLQNENPGVSKVEISRGTPGFGVFEEPLAIPSPYQSVISVHSKIKVCMVRRLYKAENNYLDQTECLKRKCYQLNIRTKQSNQLLLV